MSHCAFPRPRPRAFTLVELLVAVAIIGILAAIAVPNFLAAQTRSKVSRVKNDLRTLATALESYTADHNQPPLDWNVSRGDPMLAGMLPNTSGILHPGCADASGLRAGLTTPVMYIADCWINDPFVKGESYDEIPFDQQKFSYNWFGPSAVRGVEPNPDYLFQEYDKYYGAWRLGSVGPDRDFYHEGSVYAASRVYDATNGTVSRGNIWRSQKEAEVKARPPLDLVIDPEGA